MYAHFQPGIFLSASPESQQSLNVHNSAMHHAHQVLAFIDEQAGTCKANDQVTMQNAQRTLYHLYWLFDHEVDAFMAATYQSLIQGLHEMIGSLDMSEFLRSYKIPLRYFLRHHGNQQLARQFSRLSR